MKCNIEYVGKLRNGTKKYYCTAHKYITSDKEGNRLKECLCNYKELFNNCLNLKEYNIKSIKIIYENILKSLVPKIIVNNKEFNGVFKYDNCLLTYKDFGGIMLSKLNRIKLETIKCNHCNHYHSDNGKFAYTPHKTHFCLYCGHLFRVKEKNIGNELELIYNIPNIKLKEELIVVENNCYVEYDLLKGLVHINNKNCDRIFMKGKEISIIEFFNYILQNEF